MREIEFRGKNAKNEWVTGDLLRNRGETFICPDGLQSPFATPEDFRVDPATVGQFTGLTDKNGRKIYEGDIVITQQHGGGILPSAKPETGTVGIYGRGGILLKFPHNSGEFDLSIQIDGQINEVIGNIHDNPKLLNNESDDNNS